MKTFNKVSHRLVICLKIGDTFFITLTNVLLQMNANICFTIKENLLLYCFKFLLFVIVVKI